MMQIQTQTILTQRTTTKNNDNDNDNDNTNKMHSVVSQNMNKHTSHPRKRFTKNGQKRKSYFAKAIVR